MNLPAFFARPRLVAAVAAALLIATAGVLWAAWRRTPPPEAPAPAAARADSSANALAAADLDGDGIVYQSGMHPWIIQDTPGQCPVCGMDLTPVRVDGHDATTVEIDPVTVQNIGVRTATVAVTPLPQQVRTTGRFEADTRGLTAVSPKVTGWVERLYVEYEGARVGRGQALMDLYSPELVATQEEYLLAVRNAERLAGTAAAEDAQRLVEAARRRLGYWDISAAQIRRLEETGTPRKTLTLYAPAGGVVVRKNVVEGQQVMAGQTVLELSDLSRLWLMVDVYEQDLAWVRPGTAARVELPYAPGEPRMARVDFLYDTLDPATRTAKARVTLANPGGALKPGMYATVTLLGGDARPYPTVPAEALLRTGTQAFVLLALGEGRFQPRPVTPGVEADGQVQILEGLAGGEEVVTSAQFLIDSEARLRSALSAMGGGAPAPQGGEPEVDHSRMNH